MIHGLGWGRGSGVCVRVVSGFGGGATVTMVWWTGNVFGKHVNEVLRCSWWFGF